MSLLNLLIVAFATTRLASLIVEDAITGPIREWIYADAPNFFAELVSCFYCTAIWASLTCVLIWQIPLVGYYVLVILATAQVAEIVYKHARGV